MAPSVTRYECRHCWKPLPPSRSRSSVHSWSATEGDPFPLGLHWIPEEQSYNFALYSKHAEQVELSLREDRKRKSELAEHKTCRICGARMRMSSARDVCRRTPACLKEARRLSYLAHRHRDIEAARKYARDYAKKNPEKISEYQARGAAKRGGIAPIPTASRITRLPFSM